jgi:hypothetical protein
MLDGMAREIAIECNGARASIRISPPELLGAVLAGGLPLGWTPTSPQSEDRSFALDAEDDGTYAVSVDGEVETRHKGLDQGVDALRSYVFMHTLSRPSGRVFVHAGCVATATGSAILLPGYSSAGKSTLVAALLRAGAVYYTDDYAPLDGEGLVHPYPLPLWLYDPERGVGGPLPPEALGAAVGRDPLEATVVAEIAFREGGRWDVRRCGASEGLMLLLEHGVNPQWQPEFALAAMRRAAEGAVVVRGERGEAEEAAVALLELAEQRKQVLPP